MCQAPCWFWVKRDPKSNTICFRGLLYTHCTVMPKRCNRKTSRALWQQRFLAFVRTLSGFYSPLQGNIKDSTCQPFDIYLLENIKPAPTFLFCSILRCISLEAQTFTLWLHPRLVSCCHIRTFYHWPPFHSLSLSLWQEEQLWIRLRDKITVSCLFLKQKEEKRRKEIRNKDNYSISN